MGPYFGCGLLGHVVKHYPILQKKAKKRKKRGQERVQESNCGKMEQ